MCKKYNTFNLFVKEYVGIRISRLQWIYGKTNMVGNPTEIDTSPESRQACLVPQ